MPKLEFFFQELIDEINAIAKIAEDFIAPQSAHVLPQLAASLDNIRSYAPGKTTSWGIPSTSALRTITSDGEYEAGGRRGSERVFAEITSTWQITPLRPKSGKRHHDLTFALDGIASTKVQIFRESPNERDQEIAMWRMEIADDRSPGCYFHAHILGHKRKSPFPRSLSVPRLPIFLATPPIVLEYVLGELFQERWKMQVTGENGFLRQWQQIQTRRFLNLFRRQAAALKDASGSPWILIKSLQPEAHLFLEDWER